MHIAYKLGLHLRKENEKWNKYGEKGLPNRFGKDTVCKCYFGSVDSEKFIFFPIWIFELKMTFVAFNKLMIFIK